MLTSNHVNNEVIKFRRQVISDFLRRSRFDPFMGEASTNIIVRLADLESDGKQINVPLVNQLTGDGVGAGTLRGNEEIIDSYGFPLWADWARNAVANNRASNKESSFNVRSTARELLRGWARRIVRDDLTDMLLSIPTASIQAGRLTTPGNRVNGVRWKDASTAQKNSWTVANYDRVLFGAALGNYSSTFATAVGNVDTAADRMSAAIGSLAKQLAKQSGVDPANPGAYNGRPKITPWEIEELDEEMYVCFVGDRAFKDLQNDPPMSLANRDARPRDVAANPIFTGGALQFDGVIYKNIPEITQRLLLKGIGGASVDVEPFFLCGQAAYAYATGQMPRPTTLEDGDYDFVTGLGIESQYGVAKVAKAPLTTANATAGDLVDWGVVTGFVAAPPAA
ncbi:MULTISPECIES: phage capsid family protein [unclassified Bradyrhizobium]|uniref:phage capsid family protein n=1 Tax=unclassified Bradyrhizobium TaxID=2631580 RepID=UPI002FF019D6